jgi:hypothetical protein
VNDTIHASRAHEDRPSSISAPLQVDHAGEGRTISLGTPGRRSSEAFYVLEGEMTFLIDGRTSAAPAGSFVFLPRGIARIFWNESAAPAKPLTVFTPAGIEAYFEEVTRVIAAGGDDTLEPATALLEKHDMVVPARSRQAYGACPKSETITEKSEPRTACLFATTRSQIS